jgi:trk system potassium uptake protein TrkH
MLLIQIGGLGIMILSYFTIYTVRRRVSLADKLLLSYMLSEEDMSGLNKTLSSIVVTTLVIEAAGAILLFIGFSGTRGFRGETAFFAVFHAVSAFCNAGFALFSDSLEGFRSNPLVLGTAALLIISGGLGFSVITNLRTSLAPCLRHPLGRRRRGRPVPLSLNSRVVLGSTGILIITGIFFMYLFEHGGVMKAYDLTEQYLSAFFQSVTLRTAGFNSIPIGALRDATLFVMVLYMFIGAGSGGTAGGIKVGSLAVILSSLRSFLRSGKSTTIGKASLSQDVITRAFLILLFGLGAVFTGALVLTLTETAPFLNLLFEAVSAFGTVGLSTGVTGSLSLPGKMTIIVLMYLGRLGPLTILSAASTGSEATAVSFPRGDISIG